MEKNNFLKPFVIIFALLVTFGAVFLHNRQMIFGHDPVYYEKKGDYDKALDSYIHETLKHSDVRDIYDFKIDKVSYMQPVQNNSTNILNWLRDEKNYPNNSFSAAVEGLKRVSKMVKGEHFVTGGRMKCSRNNLKEAFFSTFGNDENIELTKKDIGFINLKSLRAFTYDINLINMDNGKVIHATLYPESNINFPITAGSYTLSVKGKVTFTNGQKWESLRRTIILDTISPGCVAYYSLKTRVRR